MQQLGRSAIVRSAIAVKFGGMPATLGHLPACSLPARPLELDDENSVTDSMPADGLIQESFTLTRYISVTHADEDVPANGQTERPVRVMTDALEDCHIR